MYILCVCITNILGIFCILCPMAYSLYLPYVEMSILYAYECVCLYVCLLSTERVSTLPSQIP